MGRRKTQEKKRDRNFLCLGEDRTENDKTRKKGEENIDGVHKCFFLSKIMRKQEKN